MNEKQIKETINANIDEITKAVLQDIQDIRITQEVDSDANLASIIKKIMREAASASLAFCLFRHRNRGEELRKGIFSCWVSTTKLTNAARERRAHLTKP